MSLRTRFFLLVALGSIVTATAAYVLHFRFLDNLERQTIDLRFSLRGDEAPPHGRRHREGRRRHVQEHKEWRWPFDREAPRARLLDQIRKGKPKVVAFDVQFSELGSAAGDNALGYALIRNHGRTVAATTEVDDRRQSRISSSTEALKQLGARAGNANLPDRQGRHHPPLPLRDRRLKSFRNRRRRDRDRPTRSHAKEMGGDEQWIDYAGSPGTVTSYSYSRVHDGKVPPQRLQGQGRGHRRDRAVAPGHPCHADGRGHVRARDPGQRDRHGAPRLSAAQPADGLEHRAHRRARAARPARQPPRRPARRRRRRRRRRTGSSPSARSSRSSRAARCRPTSTRRRRWRWRPSARSAPTTRSPPSSASACATSSPASCPSRSSTRCSRRPTPTCACRARSW